MVSNVSLRQVSLSQPLVLTKGELVPSTTTLAVLVCTAGKGELHTAAPGSITLVPKGPEECPENIYAGKNYEK